MKCYVWISMKGFVVFVSYRGKVHSFFCCIQSVISRGKRKTNQMLGAACDTKSTAAVISIRWQPIYYTGSPPSKQTDALVGK